MSKIWFLISFICICVAPVHAQKTKEAEKIIAEIRQVHLKYSSADSLCFKMSYKYMDEAEPSIILDSLHGFIQVYGKKVHSLLGNMETIANDKYMIMLFKDEKIMYITSTNSNKSLIDPVAMIDSVLEHVDGVDCSIQQEGSLENIGISFPPNSLYKHINFLIEANTKYLDKIIYQVRSEALINDIESKTTVEKPSEYAIVEANFYDYNQLLLDKTVFNESNYFIRQDKKITTTSYYKDYKIYIGSPNL